MIDTILKVASHDFKLAVLLTRMEERTPFNIVALQECERMNMLTSEMRRSLNELMLGLKVGLKKWKFFFNTSSYHW